MFRHPSESLSFDNSTIRAIGIGRRSWALKNVSAIYVNKCEGNQGEFWQPESFDRIIRDAEHLYRVVQYIGANPRRAGVARDAWNRWINPQWQAIGWDFHDDYLP